MRRGRSWSRASDTSVGQSVTGSRVAVANSSVVWACLSPASRFRVCTVPLRACVPCHGRGSTSQRPAAALDSLRVRALRGESPVLFGGAGGPDGSGCGAQQQRPPVRLQLDHHQTMGVAEPCCCSAECHYYRSPLGDNYEKKQEVKTEDGQRKKRRRTCPTCRPPSPSSRAGSESRTCRHAPLRFPVGCV
ncbi:hypothetical protein Q5P01_008591 [Channa striata]|uniref:Uncharacterized protein n=1 Tax=Channa striata TaxID=64152 RepID=A0AA88MZX8_CHASR|nr:hypothetical protein Q5P01_008591 [Channa striata]